MGQVTIPYKPRLWAVPFHNSWLRFSALVLHRRAGKTTAIINHLQRAATNDAWEAKRLKFLAPELTEKQIKELLRSRFYAHILPTYRQAKLVVWDMLKYFASPIPGIKTNEQELMVTYPNGAKLALFGADNPDSLRGIGPSGVAFDEYSQHPSNIFSEVLSKALADHLGFGIFGGTIKGKNQLYRTYEAFKNDPKMFALWQDIDKSLATEEGGTITMLRRAIQDDKDLVSKGLMTQEEFDQEWYLSPTAAVKGAVYAIEYSEAVRDGRIGIVPYDKSLKVHTVWDLGAGKNMAVIFVQRSFGQIRIIDCWQGDEKGGLPEAIKAIQNKPYIYGKHWGPHDIEATDISTGKTRKEIADTLGLKFEVVPNMPIQDGINAAIFMLSHTWIDEVKCQFFLDAIAAYHRRFDEKRGMFLDEPYHDWSSHFADAFRMLAVIEESVTNDSEEPVGIWNEVEFDIYK